MYNVKKRFVVSPDLSNHKTILDDFGITKDTVTLDIDLKIPANFDVLYITGESGSGKTVILNELFEQTVINDKGYIDRQLLDLGENHSDVLHVLNLLGLGDASLFPLKVNQLSDSQKFRAMVGKMILEGNEIIVLDEFLSTLDRDTAKSVSYNIQKALRMKGIKLVVATAHDDLTNFLMPDVLVEGTSFPTSFSVNELVFDKRNNPYKKMVEVREVSKDYYRHERLGELHYKGKYSGGKQRYWFAYLGEKVVGLIVTNNQISTDTRRINRLVVHPTYRGLGIGQMLVRLCIKETNGDIDVLASMAKYNPVFEKSGMVRVDDVEVKPPSGITKDLKKLGFNFDLWGDLRYCKDFLNEENNISIMPNYVKHTNKLIQPGGKMLSNEERKTILEKDIDTSARVLWSFRPRVMAKYKYNKKEE